MMKPSGQYLSFGVLGLQLTELEKELAHSITLELIIIARFVMVRGNPFVTSWTTQWCLIMLPIWSLVLGLMK